MPSTNVNAWVSIQYIYTIIQYLTLERERDIYIYIYI